MELAADLAELKAGRLAWDAIDHKAVLLAGPPGTGKTMFARALANSAKVPLIATSVAAWTSVRYLSGTLQAMREAFERARQQAPSILLIDEIDGISDRSRLTGDYVEYWSQVVNQFLELLAGSEDRAGVVVVGATNYPGRIDPAILRAGRLDRTIVIPYPDVEALAGIFRHHLAADLPHCDLSGIARAAAGSTGADVEAYVRRARGHARREGRGVRMDDLFAELRKRWPEPSQESRWRSAVHEAGHVIVANFLGMKVEGASLTNEGGKVALGDLIPAEATRQKLDGAMIVLMAGRAAEEVVLGDVAADGAGEMSDLARASELARTIETRFGLGELGLIYLSADLARAATVTSKLIPIVNKHVEAAHAGARLILDEHPSTLEALARALVTSGRLTVDEINGVLQDVGQRASQIRGDECAGSPF